MKCKNCTDSTCKYRTSDAEKECVYQEEQKQIRQALYGHEPLTFEQMKELQQLQLQHDWEALRNQAAISAMQGILSNNDTMYAAVRAADETMSAQVVVARNAIAYADALLQELKGE